ncbi:MAG: STAS domain-containing protein [Syntrophothermus sp.]
MDFIRTTVGNICIEKVNIERATLKEAEDFKQILMSDISGGFKNLVVDLTNCEFIDSTFLGALVVSLKKVTATGGDLKLVGFQPAVRAMFELTRMFRVFETYMTLDEAVESYK